MSVCLSVCLLSGEKKRKKKKKISLSCENEQLRLSALGWKKIRVICIPSTVFFIYSIHNAIGRRWLVV